MNSALFVQLMDQTETWYLQLPVKGLPERNKVSRNHAAICEKCSSLSLKHSLTGLKFVNKPFNISQSIFQLRVENNQAIGHFRYIKIQFDSEAQRTQTKEMNKHGHSISFVCVL